MEKFELGQKVRIVANDMAALYNLHTLGLIGTEFVVNNIDFDDFEEVTWIENGAWTVPAGACELADAAAHNMTPFQRVSEMNEAFGNPKGDFQNIDWNRVRSQCKNIFDEYCELLTALGYDWQIIADLKADHEFHLGFKPTHPVEFDGVRDALADIQVFKDGALHMMGVDGDRDMHSVIDGVMTRFIKDEADKEATLALHAAKGVTQVYFEGEYPKMVMKSAVDQPDAPKGKFLKSASYQNTVFYNPQCNI